MNQTESGKYSISPNSGRLRKRIKKSSSDDNGLFKKRLDNFSFNSKVVFAVVLLIIGGALYFAYQRFEGIKEEASTKYAPNQYHYVDPTKKK